MSRTLSIMACIALACGVHRAFGQTDAVNAPAIEIRPVSETVQIGRPIWVDFIVRNPTNTNLTLQVDGGQTSLNGTRAMGLPLSHVFAGTDSAAIEIISDRNRTLGDRVNVQMGDDAPMIELAPGSSVGRRIDLAQYFSDLRRAGTYRLQWKPYGGQLVSDAIFVTVTSLKQAVVTTDFGNMTIRFHYDVAPRHVTNFLELARDGFYDATQIHRILPGVLVQCGDPRGDGTGIRPDGTTLRAEFSGIPFEAGTVAMARKNDDPNSASCQFFICLTRIREFDGRYTVFGHLVGDESFATLQKLARVRTDPFDRPVDPAYIRSITVSDVPVERTASILSAKQQAQAAAEARKADPTTPPTPVPLAPVSTAGSIEAASTTRSSPDAVAPDEE